MKTKKKRVMLVAGGTGGHLFPALALAKACQDFSVIILTDQRGSRFVCTTDPDIQHVIVAFGLSGKGLLHRIVNELLLCATSFWTLLRWRPTVVWGFGGRMTLYALIFARCMGKTCGIHQSDRILGKANRVLARFLPYLAVGYEDIKRMPPGKKPCFVGTPIREGFDEIPALTQIQLPLQLLVLGGSQGSCFWNAMLPQAMAALPAQQRQQFHVVHQYGTTKKPSYPQDVSVNIIPFISDMPAVLTKAHVVFSRAGASCVAELCAAGRPAFFVPYPSATDNHQWWNADFVVQRQGGWMCQEEDLSWQGLTDFLKKCLHHPEKLITMGKNLKALHQIEVAKKMAAFLTTVIGESKT